MIKAGKVKTEKIIFKYADKKIATNDTLLAIGETSNYILLYNTKDSTTAIYSLSKIDSLIIK